MAVTPCHMQCGPLPLLSAEGTTKFARCLLYVAFRKVIAHDGTAIAAHGVSIGVSMLQPRFKSNRLTCNREAFDTIIEVQVGTGDDKRTFEVFKGVLCFYSGYFQAALNGRFAEAHVHIVKLPTEEPLIFELFRYWIHTRRFFEPVLEPHLLFGKCQTSLSTLRATTRSHFHYCKKFRNKSPKTYAVVARERVLLTWHYFQTTRH